MSEYTSITDGLRSSMKRVQVFGSPFVQKEAIYFDQMCDSIDAIHAQLERENVELKAELDHARDDWDFWESTHVELPKDADGKPIRIGDVMENIVCPSVHREVTGVGVECFYGWDEGNGRYSQFSANCYRHHKPDTWERIIEDAIRGDGGSYGCLEERFNAMVPALVARCKALAGDAE